MKKSTIYLITILFTISCLLQSCDKEKSSLDLSKGLIAYYPLNGNANDSSVNKIDGIVHGADPCSDKSGHSNSAYNLKGYTDYISLPNSIHLKCQLPVTVVGWVYFNNLKRFYQIFTSDYLEDKYTGYWVGLSLNKTDTVIGAGYGDGGGYSNGISAEYRRSVIGKTKIRAGQWYHFTAIIKDSMDMDIYVNSKKDEGTYDGSGDSIQYSNNPGSIGRKDCSYNVLSPSYYYLDGKVDEIRIYNRVLNEKEIVNLYQQ